MIKLRGYEPKYNHENDKPDIVSGGVMWENNSEMYFVEPITGNTSSIHHTPFEYKDLMLGSPFKLNGQTIYEEDIIEFEDSGTIGIVKQDKHLGWIISTKRGNKYSLIDSLDHNIKIISNTLVEADEFVIDNYDMAIEEARKIYSKLLLDLEEDDKFVGFVNTDENSLYSIDCVFETSKRAIKWLNKINKSYSTINILFKEIYVEEKILVFN